LNAAATLHGRASIGESCATAAAPSDPLLALHTAECCHFVCDDRVLSRGAEVFTKAQRESGHMQHVTVGPMVLDFATYLHLSMFDQV
jgi:hypothetical protein